MRTPSVPRDEVLERLTRVFRSAGFERASITMLGAEAGLQRSSLYHLFPGGKAQMADEVVRRSNALFTEMVLSDLETDDPPRERFVRMLRNLEHYYRKGRDSCLLGVLAVESSGGPFDAHVKRGFNKWLSLLAKVFLSEGFTLRESEDRASQVVATIQGALVLARGAGSPAIFRRLLKRLESRAFD